MEFQNPKEAIEFYEYLSKERKLGTRTVEIYMIYYSCFKPSLLNEDYICKFAQKHKNYPSCRGFLKNYLEFRKLEVPLPKKPKGRLPIRLPRDISSNELDTFRNHLYSRSFKKGLILDLIYQGALRRVEIITINLNSFKWDRWLEDTSKFLRLIVLGKGNKEREVLVNPETGQKIADYYIEKCGLITLEDLREVLGKDILLFKNAKGEALTEHQVYNFIKKESLLALKNRYIRPHELRHLRATELENRGVQIRDIQRYLGHCKISTTEGYLHRSFEQAVSSVENHLS